MAVAMAAAFTTLCATALAPSPKPTPTPTPTTPTTPTASGRVSPLLSPVLSATQQATSWRYDQGRERDGTWCEPKLQVALITALAPLRGRKKAWWIDAPAPLRAVVSSDLRSEISVICIPGGLTLPAGAFPAGSVILTHALCGQLECRRLRLEPKGRAPIELMRKRITQGDPPFTLLGGCVHEWRSAPGVSSALLQVVLLPPTSAFPPGGGGIGWASPPAEGCESNVDLAPDSTIRTDVENLLKLELPSETALGWEAGTSSLPDDAPTLLRRLQGKVGGLDAQLSTIVRRALASRLYPPELTRELGLPPVRGLLLYGPPGCGKTLLAREIGAALGAREPKIVNGPEMMNKYVGESEAFVRALFAEAELEQMEAGHQSALHIIVLDELDAFCRERGALRGDTSGIRDSVVNQLLAKLDGVDELNNVLVVGLTNRPELIDSALLRPGRLEVHVRVDLPDSDGRQSILQIHSRRLRERGCFDHASAAAIGSGALAAVSRGFSGAELAGLLRSATSFALERYMDQALLRGWTPGTADSLSAASAAFAASASATTSVAGDADGLLEVTFDDLTRALKETSSHGWKRAHGLRRRMTEWRRVRLLKYLTHRALRTEAKGG